MGAAVQCEGNTVDDDTEDICQRRCGTQPGMLTRTCAVRACCAGDDEGFIGNMRDDTGDTGCTGEITSLQNQEIEAGKQPRSMSRTIPMTQSAAGIDGPDAEVDLNYFDREKEELISLKGKQGLLSGAIYRFKSGATYRGQWDCGTRHGYGKMIWADGVTYEGEWNENVATGRGSFQHIDGDQYIGEWANNMANGNGVYYNEGVQTYLGQWSDDFQHGCGIESWSEGAWYEGEFFKSQKEGHGRYRWEGGCEYLGRWTNNVIAGHGKCIATDGRLFMGMWRQSAMHGIGKYTWPDGKEYMGQYWFDKKDGFGVFRECSGETVAGYWTQGLPDKFKHTEMTTEQLTNLRVPQYETKPEQLMGSKSTPIPPRDKVV